MDSDLLWDLEVFLLYPSNKLDQKNVNKIKTKFNTLYNVNNTKNFEEFLKRFNEVVDFLTLVKNLDFYKAILSLENLLGKPTFILEQLNEDSFNSTTDIYNYVSDYVYKFLNESKNSNDNFDIFVVLGACILFLNVFVRINWLGPPFSLSLESERVLSEKYQKKAVKDELDDTKILNESLVCLIDHLDLKESRSSFLLDKIHKEFKDKCVLKSPELSLIDTKLTDNEVKLLKSVISEFIVDGESVYYGVSGIQYLYASLLLIGVLDKYMNNGTYSLRSLEIWRSRVAYLWQLIVEDFSVTQCVTLYNCTIVNYINLLKESEVLDEDFTIDLCDPDILDIIKLESLKKQEDYSHTCSIISNFTTHKLDLDVNLKAYLLIELIQKLPLYNLNRLYDSIYEKVSEYLGFTFEFTGKLGVRRRHQKKSIPQLIVDYKKTQVNNHHETPSVDTPANITLDEIYGESDIYETPKLDISESMETLSEMEQLFLLSKGLSILYNAPQSDELALEFINSIATTCLREDTTEQKNWIIASTSLWLRCKTEYSRTKTIERATLQLHSISDSFYEHNPSNRMEYFFGAGFPSTWNIKREIAKHMYYIGSFRTAFDIYKQLHLWEDAIQCLLISDRKNEARELVNQRIKVLPTPKLYCYLGDIDNDVEYYKTAWKLSGEKLSRAVRSLGARSFNDGKFDDAVEYLEKALLLNPMNEQTQFLLGCSYIRVVNFRSALNSFSRVVSMNPENADSWANIASCHMNLNNMQSGKVAVLQAIKHNGARWQFWKMLLITSAMVKDVQSVCKAMKTLIDLGKKSEIDVWVFAYLVDSASEEKGNVASMIDETLKYVTGSLTEDADVWGLYAKHLSFKRDYVGALEAAFKQYRKVEQHILATFTLKKDTDELQTEFDVSNVKKLTDSLSSMVMLLKRMTPAQRSDHRASVVETLKVVKGRVDSRTPQVNQQFSREVDLLIESAEVEDVIAVYENA
ncbi:hypothetical protein MACJ_000318 [Theileria orientalis]|uniref:TPR-like protein n=1 Tax=Theileria orientalis TaxID=68886 RepID=A0A976M3W0_THEOR|nr:hypothetical protein MACJ_000318 [Theileria orientalis]